MCHLKRAHMRVCMCVRVCMRACVRVILHTCWKHTCVCNHYLRHRRWRRLFSHLSVCLLLAKSKIFANNNKIESTDQVYWTVDFVILSVCLSVCLSITNRSQFKTDLHKTSPSCRGSLNWEAYRFWGQRSSWSKISKKNYFWDQKVKGQLEVKLLKS